MNYGLLLIGGFLISVSIILFIIDFNKTRSKREELGKLNVDTETLLEELNTVSVLIAEEMDKRYNNMVNVYDEFEYLLKNRSDDRSSEDTAGTYKQTVGDDTNSRCTAVLMLRAEGITPRHIARKLGMGIGEVELILRLADKER